MANMVVWEDASARKFGWLSTLELIASAKMNAAVAVRKSSPTKTAVFLVEVGPRSSLLHCRSINIRCSCSGHLGSPCLDVGLRT